MNRTSEEIVRLYEESRSSNEAGDAIWILTSAFIIFTMQSGFGLLEAGLLFYMMKNGPFLFNLFISTCF